MNNFTKIRRELSRILLLFVIGFAMIHFSALGAVAWNMPALSPWGLFLGGMLIAGSISHVMRRILFPRLNLQSIAIRAVEERNLPAALVFTSICAILGILLFLNASMLRL